MHNARCLVVALVGVACFAPAAWSAPSPMVINEIHYNPDVKTEPGEFIELFNAGGSVVNLAGWQFTDGLEFTFPATNVLPGGFVVVAQNPAFLQTKYSAVGALGPFKADGSSALSKYGERILLRDATGAVADEVDYGAGFPWPTVGDALVAGRGSSIELIHPSLDNDLGGSWRSASASGSSPQSTTLLAAGSSWRYAKGTNEASNPTTFWRQPGFNDSNWLTAALPIGYGETFLVTVLSDMNGGYSSVFLRKTFTVANPAQFDRLVLEAQYDDGFRLWINGVLVQEANMPGGEVPYNGSAVQAIENTSFVTFNLTDPPAALLVPGTNVIAVQAHNSSLSASSDFFFDARLVGQTGGATAAGPTPGRLNSVFATNAPPQIRQVAHTPEQPATAQPVTITAKVTDPHGVAGVLLEYQVVLPGQYIELADAAYTNAANWTAVAMRDDGTAGDVTGGDDVFTAPIAPAVQVHRRLIRYRITVTDTLGASVRVPYADDPPPNFAYFVYDGVPAWRGAIQPGAAGTNGVVVTVPSNEMSRLPVFHLIAKSNSVATATWSSRYRGDAYPWAGTLVYDGKVYDHIHYRARGGVWRYSMCKNMWKFDLNRGHDLEARDNWGRKFKVPWRKLNLGASIQQGNFQHRGEQGMFESVGFRLFQLGGNAAPHTTFVTFRVIDDALEADPATQYEGDFWGVYLAVEQEDGRFLEEHDLPDSNLYKMEGGTGDLNNLGPNGPTDKSDLNFILQNYTGKPETWWRTNWNLAKYYSYQAIVQAIHHYDICYDKNFFYYFHPAHRLWEVFSWDLDLTWADNMYDAGCGGKDRLYQRLIDETSPPKPNLLLEYKNRVREVRDLLFNTHETGRLIDEYAALLRGPTNAPTLLDADRMMWDYNPKMNNSAYTDNVGQAGWGKFYTFPLESGTNATLRGGFDAALRIMKNYVQIRGAFLDNIALDTSKPNRPTLTYVGPAGYPLNQLQFRSSAYNGVNPFASMRWRVGEITDTNSPSYRPDQPQKYEIETVWDSGPLAAFADVTIPPGTLRVGNRYRVRVQHTDTTGRSSQWSLPHEFTCGEPDNAGDLIAWLRVTELMFHPPAGGYEYVELYNASPALTLNLGGVKFTQGIDYTFPPGTVLPPGGYLLVVNTADFAAFRAFYGLDGAVPILGPFSGALNNAGEQVVLRTSAGGTDIVDFTYGDGRGWPPTADGAGHSLVLLDAAVGPQGSGAGNYGGNWRQSIYLKGSPGRADPALPPGPLLNEFAAHTGSGDGADSNDWIELYNPTDAPLPLGPGWYLSDSGTTYPDLMKWAIPPDTILPARGWVSFDEATGFHNPTNTGFGLSRAGEQVFLSFLPGDARDRVVDAVSFKGQARGWSLGRYPDGGPFWFGLTPATRDAANGPPPARVVLSEVQYHPPDLGGTNDNTGDEFVEVWNATAGPVTLQNANGPWRLDGGVDFVFPTNLTLAAGEFLLVVGFDPVANPAQLAAFKTLYAIPNPSLRILGPYSGKLANSSERIALERPQAGDAPADPVSWVIVDEVIYADQAPWPCGSDGTGNSLQRLDALAHGCDPLNWEAQPPTAGRPREDRPPGLPSITTQPQSRVAPTNGAASFSVSVCGAPPFTYQWLFNGTNLSGATNPTLMLVNVSLTDAGPYSVVVSNPAGSVTSQVAWLTVQLPPFIVRQPHSTNVVRDQPAAFSIEVGGTPPLSYQWRFNGGLIAGATSNTLALPSVQTNQAGAYSVLVYNSAGSVLSSEAVLTVLVPATIVQQPTNRSVTITGTGTTNATFSVTALGDPPLTYQWRFNGADLPGATNTTLILSNPPLTSAGFYTVVVSNLHGTVTSQPAELIVLMAPIILRQPESRVALAGQTVSFSVVATGSPPLWYRWRRESSTVLPAATNLATLVVTNVPVTTNPVRYTVVVSNTASPGVLSSNAFLTVLADNDGDGMADVWEAQYGFNTNDLSDALLDSDGDGLTNREEYEAGTDPRDPQSCLRIALLEARFGASNEVRLNFFAVTNRSYTIQFQDPPLGGPWLRLADWEAAASSNRPVEVRDRSATNGPRRFYRVVTPRASGP